MNAQPNVIQLNDARTPRARRRADLDVEARLAETTRELEQAQQRLIAQQREFEALAVSLQRQAEQDGLTGLFNRQKFNALTNAEIARAKRYGTPLSLVMFDIDGFKSVNDTYGHLVGDQVLMETARVVGNRMREQDALARWGGEEFMILAPHTTLAHALVLAEQVRAVIADTPFSTVGVITCSFGVTTLQEHDSVDKLIYRADAALYQAKRHGKNRVEAA